MIFEIVTVPKNVKGGTVWDFLTSIVFENIETDEEGPFGAIQKISKKGRIVGLSGIFSVFSSFWACFFSFRFGRASEVRVF